MLSTVWSVAGPFLIAALVVVALQAAVIVALLLARRARLRTDVRNRAILSALPADVAVLTRGGSIEICNEHWSRSIDTSNPFTRGKAGERWLEACTRPPSENHGDLLRIREALAAVLTGQHTEQRIEYAWQENSQRRWSHLELRGLARPDGGAVVAHVDITPRKQLEAAAQSSLRELTHMNMRAGMGEFISVMTHEINQPLTASLAHAHALRRMVGAGSLAASDLSPVANDIIDGVRRAADVIGRARVMLRKKEFEKQPVEMNAIVSDVIRLLSVAAADTGISLVVKLDAQVPPIQGDPLQLRQVVMNLVVNAIEATRDHKGTSRLVRVSTAAHDAVVRLTVEDAGPGVKADDLPRLFEPNFTTKKDGLGVGLSISRSIVASHSGRIDVANLPQGGARFSVTLPVGG